VPPLNIKDPEAHRLAHEIAAATGKTLTRVVVDALRQEKSRVLPRQIDFDRVRAILKRMDAIPVTNSRSADEILGYDERGVWS
jgi:antitoxin VapB